MASIYRRKNKDGTTVWRAVVRIKGYPTVCNHCERKQEAEDWASNVERQIKAGQFKFDHHNQMRTFAELAEHFLRNGALEHHRSAADTLRHINYWKSRLGSFALVHLTSELIGKERQLLLDTPTPKGRKRTGSTVNRYMASLSSLFYLDLLFYHIKLRCYFLIELKAGKFKPTDAGQIDFYLAALDDKFRNPGDNPAIGLILCKSKDRVIVEYALRNKNCPIGVANFETELVESLPDDLKSSLPTIEEIEAEATLYAQKARLQELSDETEGDTMNPCKAEPIKL